MSCYREPTNGAYFEQGEHRECGDPNCRGCVPCAHDHCAARKSCAQHLPDGHLTCARCLGRCRVNLKRIPERATLMYAAALESGVDSEAANLAGASTDPRAWSERRIAMRSYLDTMLRRGKITEQQWVNARQSMEDDDDLDPYLLLGRWDMELREDYGQPSDERVTINNAVEYLDEMLGTVAQDPDQDFPLLARQVRDCLNHLDGQLSILDRRQRGAPCPDCTNDETGVGKRLVRHFGHWCEDADCERLHFADDSADEWVCPTDRNHRWDHETYEKWVEERRAYSRNAS